MKDFLVDIVSHTQALGVIDTVKITGDDKSTVIDSTSGDNSVILNAKFHTAHPDFAGVFGMPNLNKLATILNIPEYREDANISVISQVRNGVNTPVGVHFENKSGDFKNDYRFMTTEVINDRFKKVGKFRGATWHITLEPTLASIQRLKFQSQANSEETLFTAKSDKTDLKFYFGDHSTHAGEFVFQSGVTGSLSRAWSYPVAVFQSILNLDGDKTVYFSDDGIAQITVDSGLITYDYMIPAQTK